jgi:hypothetical protein
MNVITNRQIIEEHSNGSGQAKPKKFTRKKIGAKLKSAGTKFRDAGGVSLLENLLLGNKQETETGGGYTPTQAEIEAEKRKQAELDKANTGMKTSTKIIIGVAVAGVLGFIIYKMSKSGKTTSKVKPTIAK